MYTAIHGAPALLDRHSVGPSTVLVLVLVSVLWWVGASSPCRPSGVAVLSAFTHHADRSDILAARCFDGVHAFPFPCTACAHKSSVFFLLFLIYIHHPSQEIGEAVGTEKCCCRSMVLPWVFFWLGTRSPTHYGRDLSLLSAFGRTAVFWAHALFYATLLVVLFSYPLGFFIVSKQ